MDKENERIYVYSLPRKLIVYNFDGEFLNSFSVELPDDGLYPIQMYYRNGLIYFFIEIVWEVRRVSLYFG